MIITRFAPSPTGFLHIGGARTALFNYLFAKYNNGKFLLRIEDTDKVRSTKEAKDAILSSLKWLDLKWDDEVYYQSEKESRHREIAHKLVEMGKAYYCFSSQEEINKARDQSIASNLSFIFKSPWRDAPSSTYPKDISPAIRLKVPHNEVTIVKDLVQGEVKTDNIHIDDIILLRKDGTPTYMLAAVVDDHDMNVTHIIRGDDHLTNTPKQILIYKALGWEIPYFAHIPLIHGPDGAKLSKRHGAVGVEWYKDSGYLPEAICNYLLRLGWSHGNDEIISREDAIKWFDVSHIGKSPSRLDFNKMRSVNSHYIKIKDDDSLSNIIIDDLECDEESVAYIRAAISSLKTRAEVISDLTNLAKIYIVNKELEISDDAMEIIKSIDRSFINEIIDLINNLSNMDHSLIADQFKNFAKDKMMKIADVMKPVRAMITGQVSSPSVFEIISIIGKKHSIERLKRF